jgi:NifU-like protein involved in Fe-S cluster formation
MSAPLYNNDILRLAATIPHHRRLADPQGTAERRSPTCGSRVSVDVRMDGDGRVADIGLEVRACALGQASASLMAAHAIGRSADELAAAMRLPPILTAAPRRWLSGRGSMCWRRRAAIPPAMPRSASPSKR